jgi:DNA-directed RNA polymerase specialized sigma24 family protein
MNEITRLLEDYTTGNRESLDKLLPLVYSELQQAKIIELRYFGGLTIEESAEVLKISPATVKREWTIARAWLFEKVSR